VKDYDGEGNWLCLDKKSTPIKHRLACGLKYIRQVEAKIKKKVERQRMLYHREHLGEFIHIDTKKLPYLNQETAASGKEYLYMAIDDCSRWAYAAVLPDKTDDSAATFLDELLTVTPVPVTAVLTDNGKEYRGKLTRGHAFEVLLDQEKVKHIYTKIKTPKTHGKAERMIRTILMWHRTIQFESREQRSYLLTDFIEWYNTKKGHSSLKGQTPFEFMIKHYQHCEKCTQSLGS
jgi:transposase InsO family protein